MRSTVVFVAQRPCDDRAEPLPAVPRYRIEPRRPPRRPPRGCWLKWEPHDGADSIRTDPVIALTAHRHFPVGEEKPQVHASIGGGRFLAIPLRFVVSYRPDPQVRKRREQMCGDPLP